MTFNSKESERDSDDVVIQCKDLGQLIAKLKAYMPPPSIIKLAMEGKLLYILRG